MIDFLTSLDGNILLFIQNAIRNPFLTTFFKCITRLGNGGFIWIVLALILLINKKTRKVGMLAVIAIVCSFIINNLALKNLIARTRPYEVIEGLIPLVKKPSDFSFPSGHTASSFVTAGVLFQKLDKKWGVPAMILAALMGLSRLYVGVHYPSDVLVGMLDGLLISYMVVKIGGRKNESINVKR